MYSDPCIQGKYVTGSIDGENLIALVFPRSVSHYDIASFFRGRDAVSAGFLMIDKSTFEVSVFGASDSLGIPSDPERDLPLVQKALGLLGDVTKALQ
jgi:hypothetical protein